MLPSFRLDYPIAESLGPSDLILFVSPVEVLGRSRTLQSSCLHQNIPPVSKVEQPKPTTTSENQFIDFPKMNT